MSALKQIANNDVKCFRVIFPCCCSGGTVNRRAVEHIVAAALRKYDADRTGLADHALESGGGSIVSTRCTEAYEVRGFLRHIV